MGNKGFELFPDFSDLIREFNAFKVRYVVVGAFAMAFHGYIRATGDMDFFVYPSPENSVRVKEALISFGSPPIESSYFSKEGNVFQMGVPPVRIDIINLLSGLTRDEVMENAVECDLNGLKIPFLSIDMIIKNKQASGRAKDLGDVEELLSLKKRKHE
jgi:hypothetical protein